jgi:hypothetical protein
VQIGTTRSGKPINAVEYETEDAFRKATRGWTVADHEDASRAFIPHQVEAHGAEQRYFTQMTEAHFHAARAIGRTYGLRYTMDEARAIAVAAARNRHEYDGVPDHELGAPLGRTENPGAYHDRMVEYHHRAYRAASWQWAKSLHALARTAHEVARSSWGATIGDYGAVAATAQVATRATRTISPNPAN